MNKKAAISIFLTLLMVVSTGVVVTSEENIGDDPYEIGIVKEVFNGEEWVDSLLAEIDDILTFRITINYEPTEDGGAKATDIIVVDSLPACLTYDGYVAINYGPTEEYGGQSYIDGKDIYWNLTEDYGIELFEESSCQGNPDQFNKVEIYFNAIVTELTTNEGEDNIVTCTATELIGDCGEDPIERELYGESSVRIIVAIPDPNMEISKEVYDEETDSWAEATTIYYGGEAIFRINITNTGNVVLNDVSVKDYLPEFLSYSDSNILPDNIGQDYIEWIVTVPYEGTVSIELTASVDDSGDDYNVVNVSYNDIILEDNATVTAIKNFDLVKEVQDPDSGEWVKELDFVRKGQYLFRLSMQYYGVNRMPCLIVGDMLPDCCLDYVETSKVEVNGELLTEGPSYPEIRILEESEIIETCCDNEIGLEEGLLIWDFRNAVGFELNDDNTVVIEFIANVSEYCFEELTNDAEAYLWACYECDFFEEFDQVDINCVPPPCTFEKTVKDPTTGQWVEQIETYVGEKVTFQFEFQYFGNDLTYADIIIIDELPCTLEYDDDGATNVSEDLKTIKWVLEDMNISDADILTAEFDALVVAASGDCTEDVPENIATISLFDDDVTVVELTDNATVISILNHDPYPPILSGDTDGVEGYSLSYSAVVDDPDGDPVEVYFDFGDGTNSGWLGPYSAGATANTNHIFATPGTYIVKARARDDKGYIGEYGNQLTVVIVKDVEPALNLSAKMFGFGRVGIEVTNDGTDDAGEITWEMSVKGGFLGRVNISANGSIASLAIDETTTIYSGGMFLQGSIFGLGRINGTIVAQTEDITGELFFSGFALGKIVFINYQE